VPAGKSAAKRAGRSKAMPAGPQSLKAAVKKAVANKSKGRNGRR